MATLTERFFTGEKAAVTDGKLKVTFDTPSDFYDWVLGINSLELSRWQWCRP